MRPEALLHEGPGYERLLRGLQNHLVEETGNIRLIDSFSLVREKVRRRRESLGLPSIDAYLALVGNPRDGKPELDSLIAELTVGETSFFRHPEQFERLRDEILPACVKRNRSTRTLRIWSAGCANGAEAYSTAIIVHALLGDDIGEWKIDIVGTDINRTFLAEAEAGHYSDWALRDMPAERARHYFTRQGQRLRIADKYKAMARFARHNLVADPIPDVARTICSFDVILCRNVMIYFSEEAGAALARRLGQALAEGGYLLVAPADLTAGLRHVFEPGKTPGVMKLRKDRPCADRASAIQATAQAIPATLPGPRSAPSAKRMPQPIAEHRQSARQDTRARPRKTAIVQSETSRAEKPPEIGAIVALADRGEWADAGRRCEHLLRIDPCNVKAHYYYGLVLQSIGAPREAEQAWRRAIYLDRDFALAHYQLGLARKQADDVPGSIRAFRNTLDVLSGAPDDRQVSPCDHVTALDLRALAIRQLGALAAT
jgi:chemotaxis protein methyltransferase CheR